MNQKPSVVQIIKSVPQVLTSDSLKVNQLRNSLSELDDLKRKHRALAMLRTLDREAGYTLNNAVMLDWLRTIALVSTHEELCISIEDLERLALIRTHTVDVCTVLELTERGGDVAHGRTIVEGVLRPPPDCPY